MSNFARLCGVFILLFAGGCVSNSSLENSAVRIPMIDAHSQAGKYVDLDDIIPLMNKAGVTRTLLSARRGLNWREISTFAGSNPARITASVRTKGGVYRDNSPKYYRRLEKQLNDPNFGAMAEIMIYHAERRKRDAPERDMDFAEPQPAAAISAARSKGWPIVLHIEFQSIPGDTLQRSSFMKQFEEFLQRQDGFPVVLTSLGQLKATEAQRLLKKHKNLHLNTSRANWYAISQKSQPWTEMVSVGGLVPAWRKLVLQYPDRFILAFDNVWQEDWGWFYINQARIWQKALQSLPSDVAHAVAHRNAERLWRLPPAQASHYKKIKAFVE